MADVSDTTPPPDPNVPTPEELEKTIDFAIPDGFVIPPDAKKGKTFEALATLKLDEDGDLCLLKLDGCNVKPEAEAPEPAAGDQSATDSMKAALPATGLPSGMGTPGP